MKLKLSSVFLLSVFVFVLFANMIEVNAINTGFKTNDYPTEKKNKFIANVNILLTDGEPAKKTINCFDVNNNGLIAIGQNTPERKTICIYSSEGVFQYGYTFNCMGDFGVEWDEENLNIYFVRSDVVASVTPNGEILDIIKVQNTSENNSYVNHFIHATKRTIGDTEYYIRNDIGILNWIAPSYSQIIVKDITGTENVIYDVTSEQLFNMIITIIIGGAFFSAPIVGIVRLYIKAKRGN